MIVQPRRRAVLAVLVLGIAAKHTVAEGTRTPPSPAQGPSPTPTATFTPSPSAPTSTPDPTGSPTFTPTTTPGPGPTVTSRSGLDPTALPVPSPVAVDGPWLVSDIVGRAGPGLRDLVVAPDGERLVAVVDGRLSVWALGPPAARAVGQTVLDGVERVDALGVFSTTVVAAAADGLRFFDVRDPQDPHLAAHVAQAVSVRFLAADGQRVYAANDGADGRPVRLTVFDVTADAMPTAVHTTTLDVERLTGLFAAPGHLVVNGRITVEGVTAERWRIHETADLDALRVRAVSAPGQWALDLSSTRLLVAPGYGFRLLSIEAPGEPVELGTWSDTPVALARLAGDDVDMHYASYGPVGEFNGAWLQRMVRQPDGRFTRTRLVDLDLGILFAGGGTFCGQPEFTQPTNVRCFRLDGSRSEVSLAAAAPDGERAVSSGCVDATVYDGQIVVACRPNLVWLGADAIGQPRAVASVKTRYGAAYVRAVGDRLYVVLGKSLYGLERRNDRWETDSGIASADVVVSDGRRLASVYTDGTLLHVTVISATTAAPSIARLALPHALADEAPVLDGDRLFVATRDAGWLVIAGLRSGQPGVVATWPAFAPAGFAARDGVAYVPTGALGANGRRGLVVEVHDVAGAAPVPAGALWLSDDAPLAAPDRAPDIAVAGTQLVVHRGEGWLSRIDIRAPRSPRMLWPSLVPGDDVTLVPLDDARLAVLYGGDAMEILRVDDVADRPTYTTWRPWSPSRTPAPLHALYDRLRVGRRLPDSGTAGGRWLYDASQPLTPARVSTLPLDRASRSFRELSEDGLQLRTWWPEPRGAQRLIHTWCVGDGRCPPAGGSPALVAHVDGENDYVYTVDTEDTLHLLLVAPLGELQYLPGQRPPADIRLTGLTAGPMLRVGRTLLIAGPSGPPYQADMYSPDLAAIGPLTGLPGPATDMVARGTIAYLAVGSAVFAVDFTQPREPVVTAHRTLGRPVRGLQTAGTRLYALLDGAVAVFDVTEASSPLTVGRLALPVDYLADPATVFAAVEDTLYVADAGGFSVRTGLRAAPDGYVPPTVQLTVTSTPTLSPTASNVTPPTPSTTPSPQPDVATATAIGTALAATAAPATATINGTPSATRTSTATITPAATRTSTATATITPSATSTSSPTATAMVTPRRTPSAAPATKVRPEAKRYLPLAILHRRRR